MRDKKNWIILVLLLAVFFLGGVLFNKALMPEQALAEDVVIQMTWESVKMPGETYGTLRRAAVPGGWLVYVASKKGKGMTYVPDEKNEWK